MSIIEQLIKEAIDARDRHIDELVRENYDLRMTVESLKIQIAVMSDRIDSEQNEETK